MAKSKKNLIWIDLEMTGLDTNNDAIIEIATIVTDADLNVIAEGPIRLSNQMNDLQLWMSGIPASMVTLV